MVEREDFRWIIQCEEGLVFEQLEICFSGLAYVPESSMCVVEK